MDSVYIAGVGLTKFGKSSQTLIELLCQAGRLALATSKVQEVDALFLGVMNPEEFTGDSNIASMVSESMGLTGIPALRVETASSAGAAAFVTAVQAVASGSHRSVLVVAGEKMTHLTTSTTTRILAEVIDRQERQCGATMPALAAMITECYRQKHHLSRSRLEHMLCSVAMKNHFNGSSNKYAQFQQPLTEKKYLASKIVATPLRLYDCSPITDGAAAVVLTREPADIVVSGMGQGTGPVSLRERNSLTSFRATQIAAKRAYEMAGISSKDIDFAEVHDAFTPFEIISTEDLGLFPPGKGGQAVEEGRTSLGGALPINPSGGLKARGHPIGATGLAQIVEVVWRLRGEVVNMQKREIRRALTQSTGGLATNNIVTILERAENHTLVQNNWTLPPSSPVRQLTFHPEGPQEASEEGRIETFTVLYVTPDGFLPPLALALVKERSGRFLMAQGEDITQLKIGREVYLRQVGDLSFFTVKSHLRMVREGLKRLFRRPSQSSKKSKS